MARNVKTRKPVDWKAHLIWATIYAVSILVVNLYHCYCGRGALVDWYSTMLIFPVAFALFAICDLGQSWRIQPPYVIIGALISIGLLRSASSSFALWMQTGNMPVAIQEFIVDVRLALLLAGVFVAFRYTISFLDRMQYANRDPNSG